MSDLKQQGGIPVWGTDPTEVIDALQDPDTTVAVMLCSCVLKKLEHWYDTEISYEQLTEAILTAGADLVVTPSWTRAQSLGQVSDLLDQRLGTGMQIITDDYAVKKWLSREHPELKEHFCFYDSLQTCFGSYYREHHPDWKLLNITCDDINGLEASETGNVDWFLNARGCRALLDRTVGCPDRFQGTVPQEIAPFGDDRRYSQILRGHGKGRQEKFETVAFQENGRHLTAAICRGTQQAARVLADAGAFDVIRILR